MKKLSEYKQKRDLKKTPEPKPTPGKNTAPYPVFVIQKHAATRLHYDLRLEMDGVLKSWAVPKGPSLDPSVKRLAMMVEDHPYDYKDFEGVIPKGNYGAGTVMVWDKGIYGHPFSADIAEGKKALLEGLEKGVIKFALAGKKLKGGYTLVRTNWDQKKSWLLIKEKDKYVTTRDPLDDDRSAATGRSMEEITVEGGNPKAHNPKPKVEGNHKSKITNRKSVVSDPMPHKLQPMLAVAVKKPFDNPSWIFEIKWDGYRAIAELSGNKAELYSRNQLLLNNRFPIIASSLQKLGLNAVLDGEVTALNSSGLPDFQMLTHAKSGTKLVYYAFDILYHNGRDLRTLPLLKRKELLKKVLPSSGNIHVSDHVLKDGIAFFNAAKKKGLEGIVAKNSKSPYQAGIRSKNWLKIKNQMTQDCVIAGYTMPRNSRKYLGSLVLGTYENGRLTYAGRSGGSFGGMSVKQMHDKLTPLSGKKCPFKTVPPEEKSAIWVKPVLVCEVAFTQWTNEGVMRHPVFIRFREDKKAKEAVKGN